MTNEPSQQVDLREGEWLERNRARWDELVPIHVGSEMYDRAALRAGTSRLMTPFEEDELAAYAPNGWDGLRVLHLQCHFGQDTLVFAQRGAETVGIDFSRAAVEEARSLAAELGLAERARFVEANVYDARHRLPQPASFDVVYTTWGTIGWLPDVAEWARIISWFLKPGGRLYFADGHPAAYVHEDEPGGAADGLPVLRYSYFGGQPDVIVESGDYADAEVEVQNAVTWEWTHPISEVVTALIGAGMRIDFLREHDRIPWRMFRTLTRDGDGLWAWPQVRYLPLGYSIGATVH